MLDIVVTRAGYIQTQQKIIRYTVKILKLITTHFICHNNNSIAVSFNCIFTVQITWWMCCNVFVSWYIETSL